MDKRKSFGNRGEDAAAAWLESQGGRVVERQYRCRWGEIDLIAWSAEGVLCFVEVKTRSPGSMAAPREAVTRSKQKKLRDAASWYLAQTGLECPCRFDVAEVYFACGRFQIQYISGAFQ